MSNRGSRKKTRAGANRKPRAARVQMVEEAKVDAEGHAPESVGPDADAICHPKVGKKRNVVLPLAEAVEEE